MKVHVLGNVAVDQIFRVTRMPKPGQSILATARTRDIGGKGANQAIVLARAGLEVHLIAGIGNDEAAAWIRQELVSEGLDTGGLVELDCASDTSVILLDDHADNMIVTTSAAATGLERSIVEAKALHDAVPGDALLVQGNLKPDLTRWALACGQRKGLTTIFNPSPVDPSFRNMWHLTDVVVLNESEASELTDKVDPAEASQDILALGARNVVITLGERGALLLNKGGLQAVPAAPTRLVDTTGAGDTFAAVLVAAGFLVGTVDVRAVRAATAAAAITVSRLGTRSALPSPDEIGFILANCL